MIVAKRKTAEIAMQIEDHIAVKVHKVVPSALFIVNDSFDLFYAKLNKCKDT